MWWGSLMSNKTQCLVVLTALQMQIVTRALNAAACQVQLDNIPLSYWDAETQSTQFIQAEELEELAVSFTRLLNQRTLPQQPDSWVRG